MIANACLDLNFGAPGNFDLFRLSRAKETVDLAPNTIRSFHRRGLPLYHQGRAVFVSKTELSMFIRTNQKPSTEKQSARPCASKAVREKTGDIDYDAIPSTT